MKTIAIIQARMGSSRYPGKVLEKIIDKSSLEIIIDKLKTIIDVIYVSTTEAIEDNAIEDLCDRLSVKCYRKRKGGVNDVLSAFVEIADIEKAAYILRITADCPMIDVEIVDLGLSIIQKNKNEFVSNVFPATFPDGLDFEVFSKATLNEFDKNTIGDERQHVTQYFHKNSDYFIHDNISQDNDLSDIRLTLDYPEDMEVLRKIYGLYRDPNWGWALEYFTRNPHVAIINSKYKRNEALNV